jgi:glycosyltransferase involved in cell wall biosynthesis
MAVYNGQQYLQEQLSSILTQLSSQDEVVIVDDASTDNSINIINAFKDSRIRLLRNPQNLRVIKSFERALTEATGDYIFFADQDDIWLPNKVELVCQALENSVLVVSDAIVINGVGETLYSSYFQFRKSAPGIWRNFLQNTYLGCCMAIQGKYKSQLLPFPSYIPQHDEWIGLSCEFLGDVYFLPIPLIAYRRHDNNQTGLSGKNLAFMIWKRYVWIKMILNGALRFRNVPLLK